MPQLPQMIDYLDVITRFTGENLGSLIKIRVCRTQDITAFPDPVNDIIYGDIQFLEGKGWREWVVSSQSGRMKSTSDKSTEGTLRKNSLPFIIARDRAGIRRMLTLASEDEFIVQFTDSNGNEKIFGNLSQPVQFKYNRDTGGKFSALNYYDCEFYCDGPDNEFFYEGEIAIAPPGLAPALVRVNGIVVAILVPGEVVDFETDFDFDFEIIGA